MILSYMKSNTVDMKKFNEYLNIFMHPIVIQGSLISIRLKKGNNPGAEIIV